MAFCVVDFSKGKIVRTLEQPERAESGGDKYQNQEVFHFKLLVLGK